MVIETDPVFDKSLKKRILLYPKLVKRFKERLKLFSQERNHPSLKDHPLTGSLIGYRAFSINGDIRIIYRLISNNHVILYDIGSHNQVY